ncbi:MAG: GSCFA domain-containing protein [Candidatus Azobacteroides sp.]|nr:GSCFA domain-containing protein [Candidatus Azobacteroides sp.]
MYFRTIVKIPDYPISISYSDALLVFGSCFAENIGQKLLENKFDACVNPFGILYNPMSIKSSLDNLLDEKIYTGEDLIFYEGLYHSFSHHGKFSSPDRETCLNNINGALQNAREYLKKARFLIITFGTAYVYRLKESGKIAANCHKLPDNRFERTRLNINDIENAYRELIGRLKNNHPEMNIIFTVSPIRHWKDGAHENQLSKSTLLLAVDTLQHAYENVHYFPSYEIVMDELRDYRFYAEDMNHISDVAVSYIRDRFFESLLSSEAKEFIEQWTKIRKALNHVPFNAESEQYKLFIRKNTDALIRLKAAFPNLNIENELNGLQQKI